MRCLAFVGVLKRKAGSATTAVWFSTGKKNLSSKDFQEDVGIVNILKNAVVPRKKDGNATMVAVLLKKNAKKSSRNNTEFKIGEINNEKMVGSFVDISGIH